MHFRKFLEIRPESYWGNYRAAGVCYVLGAFAESAQHLERCLAIRPNNAAIRGQRAACLAWLARYPEALEECDQAIAEAPDLPELYRTRAFIRAVSGQTSDLAADLQHFELLCRLLPRQILVQVSRTQPSELDPTPTSMLDNLLDLSSGLGLHGILASRSGLYDGDVQALVVDPGELSVRLVLASRIRNTGDRQLAASEYVKILMLDPDHIPARMFRALEALENEQLSQAQSDLEAVLNNPHLMGSLARNPSLLRSLVQASRKLLLCGRVQAGQAWRKAMAYANALHQFRGETHYNLASAYAVSARSDSLFVPLAANEIWCALVAHPLYRDYYLLDSAFDGVRPQIDQELKRKPDPTERYRRMIVTRFVQAN